MRKYKWDKSKNMFYVTLMLRELLLAEDVFFSHTCFCTLSPQADLWIGSELLLAIAES